VLGVLAFAHRRPIERGAFWASMIEIFGARAAAEIQRARAEAQVRGMNESLERIVRERTAQLEDANRELESYNFSISHDLRQPLSAISGFADLLRDQVTESDEGVRDSVAEIESNALRMEQMIESLLRLSRAGRGALRKEAVDAKSVVESVLHDLSSANPLDAEVVVGELPPAQGDPALLRQVWTNLIGNALKYSRRAQAPRVEVSGVRRNGAVEYAVRDNGVGFDMKHADRLFGAFQRLPTSKGFEGSGVGLAIVERIVRRHGGTIRAESVAGQGATFRFTLPHNP
jgi:signal transduction histidine kinase